MHLLNMIRKVLRRLLFIVSVSVICFSCTTDTSDGLTCYGVLGDFQAYGNSVRFAHVRIPVRIMGPDYSLEGMLYYKPGLTRYRGIVTTHGRIGRQPQRNANEVFGYRNLNSYLASNGAMVLFVVRSGYGQSDGDSDSEFLETPAQSGMAAAKDLAAGIRYLQFIDSVEKGNMIIVGHSQGGWAALCAAGFRLEDVSLVVNISGGTNYRAMRSGNVTAQVQEDWIRSCFELGEKSTVPSMWFYSENDQSHPQSYVRRMAESYADGGGRVKLIILPPYGDNRHEIVKIPNCFAILSYPFNNSYRLKIKTKDR